MPPQAIVLALLVVGLGALIVSLIRYARRMAARMRAGWTEAARLLGGTFDAKTGPWHSRTALISGAVNGLPVRIDHYTVSTGKTSQVWTRVRADAAEAGALTFKVQPRHALSGLAEWLGFRELRTGDEAFDQAFVVRGKDPALVRAWLSPEVRAAMLQARAFVYALKGGEVSADTPKLATEPAELLAAANATAALASAGTRLSERWAELAAATGGRLVAVPEGGRRIELDAASVPLRIDTSVMDEQAGTATRVTGRVMDAKAERFDLGPVDSSPPVELAPVEAAALGEGSRLRLASSEPEKTRARWSEDVRRRIEAVAPERIVSDGQDVSVVLRGVETDEERLKEAMALADELARPPRGAAYR